MKCRLGAILILVWLVWATTGSVSEQRPPDHNVAVEMRNVHYHFSDSIIVDIRYLSGELVPTKGDLPIFDDKESFTVQVASAEIAISPGSLASALNGYAFADADAPIKGVTVEIDEESRLKIKGKLHEKGDIPFEMLGRLTSTPDGKIRLHGDKVKALHVPVKGLMDLLGIKLATLIKTGKVRGVEVEGDDVILTPEDLLPPPHIAGKITIVRIERGQIVQVFGAGMEKKSHEMAGNYMAYRGNQLRFGKLTMSDTEMVLIDMDPKDPFDFYLDHYKEQLVAGYTKETPSFGLRVYMRDYDKLHARRSHSR